MVLEHSSPIYYCVFSNYGSETKFKILFKIIAFLVHGNNRNKSMITLLEVEYVSRVSPSRCGAQCKT